MLVVLYFGFVLVTAAVILNWESAPWAARITLLIVAAPLTVFGFLCGFLRSEARNRDLRHMHVAAFSICSFLTLLGFWLIAPWHQHNEYKELHDAAYMMICGYSALTAVGAYGLWRRRKFRGGDR